MESTKLYDMIQNLRKPDIVRNFNEATENITVRLHTSSSPEDIIIKGLGPFHTLEDISRAIYTQTKNNDTFPKYSFLCTMDDSDNVQPVMGTWFQSEETEQILLQNPDNLDIHEDFVETNGRRKPVNFKYRGRFTIERVYLKTTDTLPVFHLYSFRYLYGKYPGQKPIEERDWNGIFYPYFPELAVEGPHEMTRKDIEFADKIVSYIHDKIEDIRILNDLIENVSVNELKTTKVKKLSFLWDDDMKDFDGADSLFYSAPVNRDRPFMRLLTPNTVPLTKLYQPDPLKPPFVNDITLLKTWVQDRAPIPTENCLYIKVLLQAGLIGLPPLFGTLILSDTANANFLIQPPKDVRQLDFSSDLQNLEQVLFDISMDMPYSLEQTKFNEGNITVELSLDDIPPKNIRKIVAERIKTFTSVFQEIPTPKGEQGPLFMLRYKNVNNFMKEDSVSEYITYLSRNGIDETTVRTFMPRIAKEFQISEDDALKHIEKYFEDKDKITVGDAENKDIALSKNYGTDISITSKDIKTFSFAITHLTDIQDLNRICTILSVIFYADEDQWSGIVSKAPKEENDAHDEEEIEEVVLDESIKKENTYESESSKPTGFFNFPEEEEEEKVEEKKEEEKAEEKVENKPQVQQKPSMDEQEPSQIIIAHQWYIKRLQAIDKLLFNPPKTELKSAYSAQCAANEDRLPAVLTNEQYINMRQFYSEDEASGKVGFIVYGVSNTQDTIKEAKGKQEQFTVLRYGSDTDNPNYYICAKYFCLRDLLPILYEDFMSNEDKMGNKKPVESCPICHGSVITNNKNPGPNQYVYQRKHKPKGEKSHIYVGFLKDGKHPNGFDLPCCFVKEKHIKWEDPKFKRLRDAELRTQVVENKSVDRDAQYKKRLLEGLQSRKEYVVSYDTLIYKIKGEYILGPEKYPLEPGKIGMLNVALDNYFGQNSNMFTDRVAIRRELKETANGMFRLGVMNKATVLDQSLFAALCPILGKNTVEEVARHFTDLIIPRVFINLNFGNLVNEFYIQMRKKSHQMTK